MQSAVVRPPGGLGSTGCRPAGVFVHAAVNSRLARARGPVSVTRGPLGLGLNRHTTLRSGGLVVTNVAVTEQRAATSGDGEVQPPNTTLWTAVLYTDDLEQVPDTNKNEAGSLTIRVVDENGTRQDVPTYLDDWADQKWVSEDRKTIGISFTGKVPVPNAIAKPAVLLLNLEDSDKPFYVSRVVLQDPSTPNKSIIFPVNSWIDSSQGTRIFFDGKARLPADTPAALRDFRETELAALRGTAANATEQRKGAERIYDFDVYNDLGKPTAATGLQGVLFSVLALITFGKLRLGDAQPRPALGGPTLKYPRRLRTGRPLLLDGAETPGKPWLPLDEKFDDRKQADFDKASNLSIVPSITGVLNNLADFKAGSFDSFAEVDDLYEGHSHDEAVGKVLKPAAYSNKDQNDALNQALQDMPEGKRNALLTNFNVSESVKAAYSNAGTPVMSPLLSDDDNFRKMQDQIFGVMLKFQLPRVLKDREASGTKFPVDEWETDKEFGRQVVAGQNPCIIQAIRQLPADSTITEDQLKGVPAMGGKTLAQLFAEAGRPRVFMVDYRDPQVFLDYASKINPLPNRHQYAGRMLLVRQTEASENGGQPVEFLMPVAVELTTPAESLLNNVTQLAGKSANFTTTVYTPNDHPNVWLMAKTVLASIDGSFHQLISHFVRTHASEEPYLIATRRQLSALHPVYRWLMPHFRFTLAINANARSNLINASGIIEQAFTPGKYSMEMSSAVYGQIWTFEQQMLPNDLARRDMVKLDAEGNMVPGSQALTDYPYADDGLPLWNAFLKWATAYLKLYYKSDAQVTADPELTAWWDEIKTKGHPDIKEGWPALDGVDSLAKILTTMAWTASCHHAAVNFGQYDYSGFAPNRPSIIRQPIPAKGTPEYRNLERDLETTFFKTVASPLQTATVMTTIRILSMHSENEHYISDKEHYYIFDDRARSAYQEFTEELKKLEFASEVRNSNTPPTEVRSRTETSRGLPYTLLQPTSGPGLTFRGIPTSVSI